MNNLPKKKIFIIIRYNEKIQKRLDINFKDYKD